MVGDEYTYFSLALGDDDLSFNHDCNIDFHRSGFYFALLQEQLQSAGFCSIERVSSFGLFDDVSSKTYAGISISLNVQAVKC